MYIQSKGACAAIYLCRSREEVSMLAVVVVEQLAFFVHCGAPPINRVLVRLCSIQHSRVSYVVGI